MGLLDPINPLSGLTGTPGVSELPGAESYVTGQGIQGGLNQLVDAISQRQNPLLAAGRVGLGFVGGQQQGMQNLANFQKLRQDLMKGGLDITKSGLDITQSKLNIGEKQFDLGRKISQQQNLYNLIKNLSPDQKALALSNEEEFTKLMIGNMKPTTSIQEYEYAVNNGYTGSYQDYVKNVEKYRAANYTAQLKMPEKDRLLLESDVKYVERAVEEAMSARTIANETQLIADLLKGTEGGGVVKLTADIQQALGIDTPNANRTQVVEAIRTRAAPTIRATGSGSTSDMEFKAYMSAFPSLATLPEGRVLMSDIANSVAKRKTKLADFARKLINSKEPVDNFYEQIANYDDSLGSIMSSEVKKKINELRAKEGLPPIVVDLKKSKSIVYGDGE